MVMLSIIVSATRHRKDSRLLHTYSLSGLTMVSSAGVLPERALKIENRRIRALSDTAKHEVRFAEGLF
jgi:hypothetical protein